MTAKLEPLRLNRVIRASRARVFAAFSSTESLKQWLCPVGFSVPDAEAEFRLGGRYRITMRAPDGALHTVRGVYREIRPPERLVFTWTWDAPNDMAGVETIVTVELAERGAATELIMIHTGFPMEERRVNHEAGWNGAFANLARFVEGDGTEA